MLRGSMVVFCALFSLLLIKVDLIPKHWIGIALVVIGEASVGVTAALRAKYSDWQHNSTTNNPNQIEYSWKETSFGLILVLTGSALNSVQNVLEVTAPF